jgi:hypothetical protein
MGSLFELFILCNSNHYILQMLRGRSMFYAYIFGIGIFHLTENCTRIATT